MTDRQTVISYLTARAASCRRYAASSTDGDAHNAAASAIDLTAKILAQDPQTDAISDLEWYVRAFNERGAMQAAKILTALIGDIQEGLHIEECSTA